MTPTPITIGRFAKMTEQGRAMTQLLADEVIE